MYVTQENEGILNGIDYIQSQLNKIYEQEQEYFKKIFEAVKPKLDEKIANDSIFNQEMFDFFVNEHDLTLTSGQMYDTIHFVNSHYPLSIDTCSDDELYNIFNKIVNEMNRRKEKRGGTNG